MENTTKSKILDEALVMFAENGYNGTNLRDLAAKLGLSKSALYKHYESKEAIWNALLDRMIEYYEERFGSTKQLPPQPKSLEELFSVSMKMIAFTVYDERVILTRKLLLTEQFRDERVCSLATRYFIHSNKNIFTSIFKQMMKDNLIRMSNPEMLAFAFTAPITSLIQLCTREPDKKEEVMQQAESFIKYFIENHL